MAGSYELHFRESKFLQQFNNFFNTCPCMQYSNRAFFFFNYHFVGNRFVGRCYRSVKL